MCAQTKHPWKNEGPVLQCANVTTIMHTWISKITKWKLAKEVDLLCIVTNNIRKCRNLVCTVCIVAKLWAGWSENWLPAGVRDLHLLKKISRLALGPKHPLTQWVTRLFLHVWGSWGMRLTTWPYLKLRIRMGGAVSPLPHMPSWCVEGQLHFNAYCSSYGKNQCENNCYIQKIFLFAYIVICVYKPFKYNSRRIQHVGDKASKRLKNVLIKSEVFIHRNIHIVDSCVMTLCSLVTTITGVARSCSQWHS
jgi:hypothetical protein